MCAMNQMSLRQQRVNLPPPARDTAQTPQTVSNQAPLNPQTFKVAVKSYLAQDEKLDTLQAELTKLKREHTVLGGQVLTFMRSTGCKRCETEKCNLTVSESMAQKALTMNLIHDALSKQCPGNPEMVGSMCNAIREYRKLGAGERVRLKRVKKRKPV
jgi:hypothetical protein